MSLGTTHLVYVGCFSVAAAGCFAAAWRVSSTADGDVRRGLQTLFVSSGLWAALTVAQLVVSTGVWKARLFTLGLVVGFATVGCWLYFVSAYTGAVFHRDPTVRRVAVAGFGVVTAVKLTNPLHRSYFSYTVAADPFPHLVLTRYAPHWMITSAAYLLAAIGFVLLVRTYHRSGHDTGRLTLLAGATAVPVVPDAVAVLRPGLLLGLTYEPLGVAVFAVGSLFVVRSDAGQLVTAGRSQLVDELRDPVVVVDADGRVRDANPAAVSLFAAADWPLAVGQVLPDAVAGLDWETADAEPVAVGVDDETRRYLVRSSPVSLGPRRLGRAVVFTDVTALESQRRTLRRQRRELDHVAEAVTHELRNDLNIAVGYADAVADGMRARDDGDAADSLATLRSAHRRMNDVVDDLATLARVAQAAEGTASHRFDEVVRRARRQIADRELDVTVDGSGTVVANRTRLIAFLSTLLGHAADREATRVTVSLDAGRIVVRHDGRPIPPARRGEVFDHGSPATDGIGLANAAAFARSHGWSLTMTTADGETGVVADGVATALDHDPTRGRCDDVDDPDAAVIVDAEEKDEDEDEDDPTDRDGVGGTWADASGAGRPADRL